MAVKPLGGWGADRAGRKPIMVAGAALFCVSPMLYAWSHTVGALLGIRLLHGAGVGLYPAAGAAMVADLSPPDRRGEAVGFWGAAGSTALALGPLGAVWIVDVWGFAALFHLATGIALAALILTVSQRETLARVVAAPFSLPSLLSRAALFPSFIIFCSMTTYGAS
jgi:DHA2 family multidrug resistance protein